MNSLQELKRHIEALKSEHDKEIDYVRSLIDSGDNFRFAELMYEQGYLDAIKAFSTCVEAEVKVKESHGEK